MSESQYRLDVNVDLPEIDVTTDESTSRGGSRKDSESKVRAL